MMEPCEAARPRLVTSVPATLPKAEEKGAVTARTENAAGSCRGGHLCGLCTENDIPFPKRGKILAPYTEEPYA